jgi:hypothetical protein
MDKLTIYGIKFTTDYRLSPAPSYAVGYIRPVVYLNLHKPNDRKKYAIIKSNVLEAVKNQNKLFGNMYTLPANPKVGLAVSNINPGALDFIVPLKERKGLSVIKR